MFCIKAHRTERKCLSEFVDVRQHQNTSPAAQCILSVIVYLWFIIDAVVSVGTSLYLYAYKSADAMGLTKVACY